MEPGFAHALNLKESGVPTWRGAAQGLDLRRKAKERAEGHGGGGGRQMADVVMMLTPDELQGEIYANDLAPNLKQGAALLFATASTSTST